MEEYNGFKIGERVRVAVGNTENVENCKPGDIGVIVQMDSSSMPYHLKFEAPHQYPYSWVTSIEHISVNEKKSKPIPIEKHVVIKDSCGNFLVIKDSYKDAEEYARAYGNDAVTIYKMIEVAKVSTKVDRIIKRVPVKRK